MSKQLSSTSITGLIMMSALLVPVLATACIRPADGAMTLSLLIDAKAAFARFLR